LWNAQAQYYTENKCNRLHLQVGMFEYYGYLRFLYEYQDGVFYVSDITMLDYDYNYKAAVQP